MATLDLKEMGKFLWKFSHFKVSSFENSKKKSGIMKSGLDAMPLFLIDDLLIEIWWFDEKIARKLHFRCVN